jgi:hypothetical protein
MGVFDDDGVDTDYYAKLLKEDSKPKTTKTEDAEFEEIPSSTESNSKNIEDYLDENTSSGMSIMELAGRKQQAERALKRKQSDQVSEMFSKLFNDLNQKYGLDVQLDFNSFSKSLNYIIQPKNKKALELYLSEAYGRFRVVLYSQYLNAISLLSAQILNPDYILSDSLSYGDKLLIMKQLYEFMQSLNDIYKEVNINDTDQKLTQLADDNKHQTDIDDPDVRNFLTALTSSLKDKEK